MFVKKTYGDFTEIHTKDWSMLLRDGDMPMAFTKHENCFIKEMFEGSPAANDWLSGLDVQVLSNEMFDNAVGDL
jgi:hypothetical protein